MEQGIGLRDLVREIGIFKWFMIVPFGIVFIVLAASFLQSGSLHSAETGPYLQDEKQFFRKYCVYYGMVHDTLVPAGEAAPTYAEANRATCPSHL